MAVMKKIAILFLLGGGGWLIWRAFTSVDRGITDGQSEQGFAGGLIDAAYGLGDSLTGSVMGGVNGDLNISGQGLEFLKRREGFRGMPYYATDEERAAGIRTIGYGYTYKDSDFVQVSKFSKGISEQDALKLLVERVGQDVRAIRSGVKVRLTQNQFDALVSLRYNVGSLAGSNLIGKLNAGDYIGASEEIMGWVYQKGKFMPGLYKRRAAEQQMFVNGVYNLIWN
jgi:lysozyme